MEKRDVFSFRRGDFLAIGLVLLLALAVAAAFLPLGDSPASTVQVYQDGALVRELPLHSDARFELSGEFTNIIAVEDGRAAIIESDCPGADCVRSGWIGEAGRSIVCLPNRVELRLTGDSGVDFVVR